MQAVHSRAKSTCLLSAMEGTQTGAEAAPMVDDEAGRPLELCRYTRVHRNHRYQQQLRIPETRKNSTPTGREQDSVGEGGMNGTLEEVTQAGKVWQVVMGKERSLPSAAVADDLHIDVIAGLVLV